tara:strand:- start:1690 stop:2436 length:747 start_codon:yes stop_codon:yes gene_type:complete
MNNVLNKSVISHIKTCKIFAFFAGIFYSLWILTYFVTPIDILNPTLSPDFFDIVSTQKFFFILNNVSFIFASFCMIGIVSTFNFLGRQENYGILNFISLIGTIGFSFGILSKTSYLFYVLKLIPIFDLLSPTMQEIITTIGIQQFDYGVMSFGATGLWFFIVSYLALNNQNIPKQLSITSLLIGFFSISLVIFGFIYPSHISQSNSALLPAIDLANICFVSYIFLLNVWVFLEAFYLHSFDLDKLDHT